MRGAGRSLRGFAPRLLPLKKLCRAEDLQRLTLWVKPNNDPTITGVVHHPKIPIKLTRHTKPILIANVLDCVHKIVVAAGHVRLAIFVASRRGLFVTAKTQRRELPHVGPRRLRRYFCTATNQTRPARPTSVSASPTTSRRRFRARALRRSSLDVVIISSGGGCPWFIMTYLFCSPVDGIANGKVGKNVGEAPQVAGYAVRCFT